MLMKLMCLTNLLRIVILHDYFYQKKLTEYNMDQDPFTMHSEIADIFYFHATTGFLLNIFIAVVKVHIDL